MVNVPLLISVITGTTTRSLQESPSPSMRNSSNTIADELKADHRWEMHGLLTDENTFLLNISLHSPLDWAVPLYGYMMPVLVAITTVTNTFIIIVLSQKHLRTPTNIVLLAMAVTDLLTGCTSVPWFVYYYTLQGYHTDQVHGLPPFWCHAHAYMFEILPSVFHTAAIWLTVFLAVQRYVYVCVPNHVYFFCTPRTTKLTILGIITASFISLLPDIAAKRRLSYLNGYAGKYECYQRILSWVGFIGKDLFYSVYSWMRVILHSVPCLLLLIFTYKLGSTLKQAEVRKKSWAISEVSRKTSSYSGRSACLASGRSLYATNRMLAVICSVFLLLEIPAAILNVVQFLIAMSFVESSPEAILNLNRILVIRNLLIVLASPIQFGIYCSMSEQFRLTVRQLFTSRLLFIAQAQATFHGGKRYSLILIDVESEDQKKYSAGTRLVKIFERNQRPQRKCARQTSILSCDREGLPLRTMKSHRTEKAVYRSREDEDGFIIKDSASTSKEQPHFDVETDEHL